LVFRHDEGETARLNRIAALWTAAAVILGTASSIFGSLIDWIIMAKTPPTDTIAAGLTAPERVLLFCLASDTDWVKAARRSEYAPWIRINR
jgi:hypothetical protein